MTLPPNAYSANENQVLIDHWHTPTTFKEMSRLLDGRRTLGSIKNQGYTMLKLGKRREGSNLGKPVYVRQILTPWPDGVWFEDDPIAAAAPCNLPLAVRVGRLGR